MKKLTRLSVSLVLCSILLRLPSIRCLSLQKVDRRDIADVSDLGELQETVNTLTPNPYPENPLLTTQSTVTKILRDTSTQPHGTSSNAVFTAERETQHSNTLLSNSTVNTQINSSSLVYTARPLGQSKGLGDNGILTTAISTVDYTARMSSPSKITVVDTDKGAVEKNGTMGESSLGPSSQVNTMEMLTANPRTSNVKAEDDQVTMSLHHSNQNVISTFNSILSNVTSPGIKSTMSSNVESLFPDVVRDLESTTQINRLNGSANLTSLLNGEYGDTQIVPTAPELVTSANDVTATYVSVGDSDTENTAWLTTIPGTAVQAVNWVVQDVTETIFNKDNEEETPAVYTEQILNTSGMQNDNSRDLHYPAETSTSLNKESYAAYTDITEQTTELSKDFIVTAKPEILLEVITPPTSSQIPINEAAVETVTEKHWESPGNTTKDGLFPTEQIQFGATPNTKGASPEPKENLFTVIVQPVNTFTEAAGLEDTATSTSTVTPAFVSSQINVMDSSSQQISSTVVYGDDRLESEEVDDEDGDEDDEDGEDDEEEEEDEEDKDTDSVDESIEGDSEQPPFTLPVLSSQEPALMEETNHVPYTLEWERQNQGLVRSWMEKLKDKAGYMSGMLVPVGVGIAGALFILVALYSIEIMNRRRRNGFKRHKRKREFNSMQDRVMLLADSSEDEF
ncbi:armadillo-like helical domain-containing protein 4 [Bombina bombina]|uniref:armadillo-like helical domain-containing protein 4 n=1 Tax=Bombina bombina TaxID=8345 RepID=UPI00235A9DD0|nr:armadillo-like helical domain-containing protein 4 [Bombina bombina]